MPPVAVERVITHVAPPLQDVDGAPPKFGAVNPVVAVAVRVAEVSPSTGPPFSMLTVIPTVFPVIEPCRTVTEDELAVSANQAHSVAQAELSNVAASAVSESGTTDPFAIVTQTPPGTLVALPQPVWNATGTPPEAVVAVMLKMAVKSTPVVGGVVKP